MNRNRLPRWINHIVDYIADHPMSLMGRIAAVRLGRPDPTVQVATTEFHDAPLRVLIAPVNYAGQGTAWARALERRRPDISARSMAIDVPGGFAFDADLVIPVSTYHNDSRWQHRQLRASQTATHVLIEAEEPPLGRLLGRSVEQQAKALTDAGVSVAYLAHGTDARLPSRHIAQTPWSYYTDPSIYAPRAETLAARNIALLQRSAGPVFVSTPDLLLDLPDATWCPIVVDPRRWDHPRTPRTSSTQLRVAHAPSVAAVKGTHLILPVLERLAADGTIDLTLVSGVPSAQMPEVFAQADVVIDQFRIGSYGAAACEAMASGCVVVGHVSDHVRSLIAEQTGLDLPIIEATPDSLERVLRELTRSDLARRQAQGRTFVKEVHDGRLSAQALDDVWIAPTEPRGSRA